MWGDAERAALRGVAHLLPERWQQVVDVAAADVPPAPTERIPAPSDPAASRLDRIDHIVVVMRENRSFDHTLGYLSLPSPLGGGERGDVDGLRGPEEKFSGEAEDPDHSGESVDEQLADGAPRAEVPDHSAAMRRVSEWRASYTEARFTDPVAAVAPPRELTDFQNGFYEMARLLRQAGLPGGHP